MDKQSNKSGVQRDWQGKLTGCQYVFGGINNIIDSVNLNLEEGKVVDGVNVDFDNTNSAVRRTGYKKLYTGSFHSAWNDESKTTGYMVAASYLYEFDGVSTPYPILALTSNARMEFCQVNDVVVYSNGTDFGILGGEFSQQRTYSSEFKSDTLGGRCLEFYNGRLYFSRGKNLYCTDVFDVAHVDVRFTRVATFQNTITMCKRVEDGLWIGTEKYVYFLKGDDIREGGFEQIIAAKAGVVYGTACKTNAEYLPESQNSNNVVIFLTSQGICSGGNGGKYFNHSFNEVTFDTGLSGAAIIKTEHGVSKYIVSFDLDAEYEYNPYNLDIDIEVNTL